MNKKSLIFFSLLTCLLTRSFSQVINPAVSFQTGFTVDINTHFSFSGSNNYLFSYNDFGEYLLWDVRAGKQMKRITPISAELPSLYYIPQPRFSKDERYVLIPEYARGSFILYDLPNDKFSYTFKPQIEGEVYTNAFFSEDAQKVLIIGQKPGGNDYCAMYLFNTDGRLLKTWNLSVPSTSEISNNVLVKLMMRKYLKILKASPNLYSIAVSPSLDKVYFYALAGGIYSIDLSISPVDRLITRSAFTRIDFGRPDLPALELAVIDDKLVVKGKQSITEMADNRTSFTDTLFVVNISTNRLEKKVICNFIGVKEEERSNYTTSSPVTTNSSMSIYVKMAAAASGKIRMTCYDLLTDRELFQYDSGNPFNYDTDGDYRSGELNGGYVVAISDDAKLIAENARELIIHDVEKRKIKTQFSLIKGHLKLNQPVFIDANRLIIPKTYNDAFMFDLSNGKVSRLKREINCQDTTRRGANVFFHVDISAQIGLQNISVSPAKDRFMLVNYMPDDLCSNKENKHIEVWDAVTLRKTASYSFQDPEYSYHVGMIPEMEKTFLINYKLVKFSEGEKPVIRELKIIQKKDTFVAVNPVYIPGIKAIFSILGTRARPGNPDLMFAQWDLNGKLIKSSTFKRKKSKLEYQTYIYESQLSSDNSRLLFGLHDGTAGIFDIQQMKLIDTVEHGTGFQNKLLDLYQHIGVLSACFIDNNTFVTCGNDGIINLWSVNSDKPLKRINKDALIMYGISLSPDGKYLFGTDSEKTIKFINIETGFTDLNFTAFNYEAYAMVTKEGYFMSNKKSNQELSFLYNSKSYDFSQFDLILNRPDKVIEKMGHASAKDIAVYKMAYDKRLQKLGYDPTTFSPARTYNVPELILRGLPDDGNETSSGDLSFSVAASDRLYPVTSLFISVNGVPAFGSKGLAIKQAKPGEIVIPVKIPLSYGKNQVAISVMNKQGNESFKQYINLVRKGSAPKPDLYIISIGSGSFIQKKQNLKYPAKDAQDIVNMFKSRSADYGKINTYLLTNEKVLKGGVFKIKEQLRKTKPDDMVILFFAGHGMLDSKLNYFLSTYSTDFSNPALQAMSYDDLENIMDSIPARNKVILLDACQSAEVDKEGVEEDLKAGSASGAPALGRSGQRSIREINTPAGNSFKLMQTLFSDLRRSSGSSVIAAAGATELAVEEDRWNNGAFTYALQIGLKEKQADLNKDGKIQLSELVEFLQSKVSELTHGAQQPSSRKENLINDIQIW